MNKAKQEDVEKGYDFSRSAMGHKKFKFGARDSNTITVDVSLANLFHRLTVECRYYYYSSNILVQSMWFRVYIMLLHFEQLIYMQM